mgnify:FL=1
MADNLPPLLYVVSGVLFILALRGLSSPETAREGNRYGMIGMALAVVTTLFVLQNKNLVTWALAGSAVAIGGGVGAVVAQRVKMTEIPQPVASFDSLVALAPV